MAARRFTNRNPSYVIPTDGPRGSEYNRKRENVFYQSCFPYPFRLGGLLIAANARHERLGVRSGSISGSLVENRRAGGPATWARSAQEWRFAGAKLNLKRRCALPRVTLKANRPGLGARSERTTGRGPSHLRAAIKVETRIRKARMTLWQCSCSREKLSRRNRKRVPPSRSRPIMLKAHRTLARILASIRATRPCQKCAVAVETRPRAGRPAG